jgi:hypothetical protein
MKRLVILSLLNLCLAIGLMAQSPDKKQNLPQQNSKVTKEYDENGNLTRFDSVYTYSWSGDTTMMKSFSPQDLSKMFGGNFGFLNDSAFNGKSFFEDFDKMFANPFSQGQDSLLMKHFGQGHQFHQFNNDSIAFNFKDFDDIFGNFFESENDTASVKKQDKIAGKSQSKSMEEMMQMFQQQFKEMEKRHKQFFENNQKSKEF